MKPIIAIPATIAIVYRAHSRNSLTPFGLVVATVTAILHALHPSALPFTLLGVFFLAGTAVTKVKHGAKARLTQSASGPGGEGPRTHVQVLANSGVATLLTLLHGWAVRGRAGGERCVHCPPLGERWAADVLLVGVVGSYAAVAADTFSSELGILATGRPRLITAPWRSVARGTNGGVTGVGLVAGLGGSGIIAAVVWLLLPFCEAEGSGWDGRGKAWFAVAIALVGVGGSVLDSLLGALLQASVVDVRSGKVVEGSGGRKVLVHVDNWTMASGSAKRRKAAAAAEGAATEDTAMERHESRRIETGWDVLDNNGVNLLMAASVSVLAMLGACVAWQVPPMAVVRSVMVA